MAIASWFLFLKVFTHLWMSFSSELRCDVASTIALFSHDCNCCWTLSTPSLLTPPPSPLLPPSTHPHFLFSPPLKEFFIGRIYSLAIEVFFENGWLQWCSMTSLKQQFDAFDYVAPLILALVASTAFSLMTLLMYCCCFRKCFDKDRHSLLQKVVCFAYPLTVIVVTHHSLTTVVYMTYRGGGQFKEVYAFQTFRHSGLLVRIRGTKHWGLVRPVDSSISCLTWLLHMYMLSSPLTASS